MSLAALRRRARRRRAVARSGRAASRCSAPAPSAARVLARLASWNGTALGERAAAGARGQLARAPTERPLPAWRRTEAAQRLALAPQRSSLDAVEAALRGDGTRIVIDATASEVVAERHAHWLARGIHVVTACKIGQGTSLVALARDPRAARDRRRAATATARPSAPDCRCCARLRELQAGGDRIHAIAGVLSGSLAWLFNHYDGMRPFSALVRQARDAGYTEPDPRDDLSGEDVRRKLLILARTAGVELEAERGRGRHRWCRRSWRSCRRDALDAALPALDAPLRERYADAYKRGEKLRFIARLQDGTRARRAGVAAGATIRSPAVPAPTTASRSGPTAIARSRW